MSTTGGQLGNQNGKKGTVWSDAIRKEVMAKIDVTSEKGLVTRVKQIRVLARKLIKCGLNGDLPALREIGDRLEGKPAQAIEIDTTVKISLVERVIVQLDDNSVKPALEHKPG